MTNMLKKLLREIHGFCSVFLTFSRPRSSHIIFHRNIQWLNSKSNVNGGVRVSSSDSRNYPEVTGYLIPSLRRWGLRNLADDYLKYLLDVQNNNGSFLDPSGTTECIFDTGQIIRGLLEYTSDPNVTSSLQKAVKWIENQILEDGKVIIPEREIWGGVVPEAIILYALEPALRAAQFIGDNIARKKISLAIAKYVDTPGVAVLTSLNHFHAYILEALVDLGEYAMATEAICEVISMQKKNGRIPAKKNKYWGCSTGQFQYALICFKLGLFENGNTFLNYGMKRQNKTGGWFGTLNRLIVLMNPLRKIIPNLNLYFPYSEIPWANKYFLDAVHLRQQLAFEIASSTFPDEISMLDGRAELYLSTVKEMQPDNLLDFGCGKGRYLSLIKEINPNIDVFAYDISKKVMAKIPTTVKRENGSFYESPYLDEQFSIICAIESLEHAVYLEGAIQEIKRILKKGGKLLIIDKSKFHHGYMKVDKWEQWFSVNSLRKILIENGFAVQTIKNISYEKRRDHLFNGWIATKQ